MDKATGKSQNIRIEASSGLSDDEIKRMKAETHATDDKKAKEEIEKINAADSISYNEFKELYGNYEYTAYPSISNTDPDNWRKFRVIFPLAHTLSIPNDSLSVLKLLRRMVCKYEDNQHNLGAYINKEQWAMRREHDGRLVSIGQDTIVHLDALIKSLKTYSGKFKKSKDGHFPPHPLLDIGAITVIDREWSIQFSFVVMQLSIYGHCRLSVISSIDAGGQL